MEGEGLQCRANAKRGGHSCIAGGVSHSLGDRRRGSLGVRDGGDSPGKDFERRLAFVRGREGDPSGEERVSGLVGRRLDVQQDPVRHEGDLDDERSPLGREESDWDREQGRR